MPRRKAYFLVKGLAPANDPAWGKAPAAVRRAFMGAALAYVLKAKDEELAAGLDRKGAALAPISARTRANRQSAMGPADPNAPPLMPAYATSRTRLWLTGRVIGEVVEVSWLNDWGRVLVYHAEGKGPLTKRDVIGISPEAETRAKGWALGWWITWKRTGRLPEAGVPATAEFRPLTVTGRTDYENFTFGIGVGPAADQQAEIARSRLLLSQGRSTGFSQRRPGQGLPAIGGPGATRFGGGGPPPAAPQPKPPPSPPKFGPTAGAGFTEASDGDFKAVVSAVFGREVSQQELATLAGSPDGSEVFIYADAKRGKVEVGWDAPDAHAARTFRREGGSLVVHNDVFRVKESARRKGTGAASFGREVEAARAAGAERIETYAGRDASLVGYKVWPRFGYDAPLPPDMTERLPEALKGAARLSDLMKTEEGRAWWDENGRGLLMEFDLTPGSLSVRVWEAYLLAKATVRTSRTAISR